MTGPNTVLGAHRSMCKSPRMSEEQLPTSAFVMLGTWGLSEPVYPVIDGPTTPQLVREAFDLGVKAFDCADAWGYGLAEEAIASLGEAEREDVFVVTRIGQVRKGGHTFAQFEPAELRDAAGRSVKRLQRKPIDVLLLHNPPNKVLSAPRFLDAMGSLKKDDVYTVWGGSTSDPEAAMRLLDLGAKVLSIPLHLFNLWRWWRVLDRVERESLGVFVSSPLLHGVLAEPSVLTPTDGTIDHRQRRFSESRRTDLKEGTAKIQESLSLPLIEVALRTLQSIPAVKAIAVGARNKNELQTAVQSAKGPLSTEEIAKVEQLGLWPGRKTPAPATVLGSAT